MTVLAVRALDAAWVPTSQQSQEPDTTFMLDPAQVLAPAFGGVIDGSQGSNPATIVAGKFLQGYQPSAASQSYVWLPLDGLLNPDEFTIEGWWQADTDWGSLATSPTFFTLGSNSNFLDLSLAAAGNLRARVNHFQNPATPGSYSAQTNYSGFGTGVLLANTWVQVAVTLKNGTLSLVVNGSVVATQAGVVSPLYWSNTSHGDGVWFLSSVSANTSTHVKGSDFKVSRQARTPGVQSIIAVERSVVTINSTPTGATVQPLAGMLKALAWKDACGATPNAAIDAQQVSLGVIKFARAGSFLQTTPILAGGTPDATHPSVGHSGQFCYDWQVVDRTLRYWDSLGVEGYINLTGTPQILGGSNTPWKDTLLTTTGSAQVPDVSGTIAFTTSIPNDNTVLFGYGGNVYTFTGGSGSTASGCTLVSGTPGLSIPAGSSVHWGNLTTGYVFAKGSQNHGPPTSPSVATATANLATMAGDLAYHIYNELSPALSNPPVYWSMWNEPDGGVTWETGASAQPDWLNLYGAVASAVKAINASAKIAGPEVANWSTSGKGWIQALINYCGTLPAPTATAAAQVGGYSGTRTFNGATAWFYRVVARNGTGNSLGSTQQSATPATGGSVLITPTLPPGTTTWDIYATSTSGTYSTPALLASGIPAATANYTDTGTTLTAGALPSSAAAGGSALDAISWHFYSGDLSEPYQMRLQVDAWCTTAGLSTGKPFISGEWDWQLSNAQNPPWYQTGGTPSDYMLNDWEAAFSAAALIQMQAQNVIRAVGGNDDANSQFVGWFDNTNGTPMVSWNAHRLWSKLGPTLVGCSGPQTVACDPGIHAIASKDGGGKFYVLIANLHYRKIKHDGSAKNAPVLITGIPVADGTNVTAYAVDDQHSNFYDAGPANASLQTVSTTLNAQGVNKVSGGQFGLVMRPRGAYLAVVG